MNQTALVRVKRCSFCSRYPKQKIKSAKKLKTSKKEPEDKDFVCYELHVIRFRIEMYKMSIRPN